MAETNWYQELGLPQPEETGANEQGPADPATDEAPEGANEQEIADPAEAGDAEEQQEPSGTGSDAGDAPQGEPEQDANTRRQQAAARREREQQEQAQRQQEAINNALKAEREKWEKEVFGKAGIKDPFTGKPVQTMEDWRAFQQASASAKLTNDLKAGRLTPEGLQQALMQSPEIQQILSGAQEAQRRAEQAEQRAGQQEFAQKKEAELAEIRRMNPEVKSLDDIMRMESGPKFAEAVRRGNNYVDAYRLANFDALQRSQRAAGEQAARNAAAGMQHQQRTRQQQGSTPAAVPAEVKAYYRMLNPSATDAEISAHYNKTHKA